MSTRLQALLAAAVAAIILIAGFSYAAAKKPSYQSSASLLLAPVSNIDPNTVANLIGSFTSSGTGGTYVELVSSADTLRRAQAYGVSVSARAVPDSRAIDVTATGPQSTVTPVLSRVLRAAITRGARVGDGWELQVLQSPSAPTKSGPSRSVLLVATVVLALLGALFVAVVTRRYRPGAAGGGGPLADLGSGDEALTASLTSGGGGDFAAVANVSFELENFRYIRASAATVLLQLIGYWRCATARQLEQPVLLLHDGRQMHPLAPVAEPNQQAPVAGPDTTLWKGSYAAPVEIFNRHQRVAVRAGSGVVIGLPQPREQVTLATAPPSAGNGVTPDAPDAPLADGGGVAPDAPIADGGSQGNGAFDERDPTGPGAAGPE